MMMMRALPKIVLAVLLATLLAGCNHTKTTEMPSGRHQVTSVSAQTMEPRTSAGDGVIRHEVIGVPLIGSVVVGKPAAFGNLTIFPLLAAEQPDLGPVSSLDRALESGRAEVRELGADELPAAQQPAPQQVAAQQPAPRQLAPNSAPQNVQQRSSHERPQLAQGPTVGTLVIENKADVPIYVLAGTIVKGGKQDRQIGQDFIIGAKSTVPVDAFCVEQGRWSGNRAGQATGGKFRAVKQLANTDVRSAGQYEANQGKVWKKVAAVNRANSKSSASDSLLATVDDEEIRQRRATLATDITRYLASVQPGEAVIGFSYAIDGDIKSVRWFATHQIFSQLQEVMVNTSASDAITAAAKGTPSTAGPPPGPEAVASFVQEIQAVEKREVKTTTAGNVNEYAESPKGYGSTTTLQPSASPNATSSSKKKVKMSHDYVAK